MAAQDGISTIIATPHQLGSYGQNRGNGIKELVQQTQAALDDAQVPLRVLPGADVRIEPGMLAAIQAGEVLSLADHRRHVLLELPHELYISLDTLLAELQALGMQGILSHPERNAGILARPRLVEQLVDQGCLMQVTAGSLMGTFGPASQQLSESMLVNGLVHFLATDAHGVRARLPLLQRAATRASELVGAELAQLICRENPQRVADGQAVPNGRMVQGRRKLVRWLAKTAA
jgi:protein-tyrosine phosphatase